MITYEQAKKIALGANSHVNECHEFDKAWVFIDNRYEVDGDGGVVVMKTNGRTKSFIDFVLNDSPDPAFKTVKF